MPQLNILYYLSPVLLHLYLLAHAGSKLQTCECFLGAFIFLPIVDLSFPRVAVIEVLVESFLFLQGQDADSYLI